MRRSISSTIHIYSSKEKVLLIVSTNFTPEEWNVVSDAPIFVATYSTMIGPAMMFPRNKCCPQCQALTNTMDSISAMSKT